MLRHLERVRAKHPGVRVILLSVHGDPTFIHSAVALGTDGYVLKNSSPSEVVAAVRAVMSGVLWVQIFSPTFPHAR